MIYMFAFVLTLCFVTVALILMNSFRVPVKLKKAGELFELGKLDEAGNIVRGILEKNKNNVSARYIRAQILIEQKQYLLAISELNGILSIPGFNTYVDEPEIHYHLADMYKATNSFQKEIEEYRIILTFNPEDAEANMRIGLAMYNKRNYAKAQEYLLKAATNGPQPSPCLLPLGVSMFNNGEYEKSEQYLLKSLDNDMNNPETMFYLGSIYKLQKDYERATNMLLQSKSDTRFYVQSLRLLGEIYFIQERYDKVIECLEPGVGKLTDTTADGLIYRYTLAESYEIMSRIKDALTQWEAIAKTDSNFRDVKDRIETYKSISANQHIMDLLSMSSDELQEYISEIISVFNYTIVSKERVSANEYMYKAFSSQRMGDPQALIFFNRALSEITEKHLNDFDKRMSSEKCKTGLYITTSSFNMRAQSEAPSKQIELYDGDFVSKAIEKIKTKNFLNKK